MFGPRLGHDSTAGPWCRCHSQRYWEYCPGGSSLVEMELRGPFADLAWTIMGSRQSPGPVWPDHDKAMKCKTYLCSNSSLCVLKEMKGCQGSQMYTCFICLPTGDNTHTPCACIDQCIVCDDRKFDIPLLYRLRTQLKASLTDVTEPCMMSQGYYLLLRNTRDRLNIPGSAAN